MEQFQIRALDASLAEQIQINVRDKITIAALRHELQVQKETCDKMIADLQTQIAELQGVVTEDDVTV